MMLYRIYIDMSNHSVYCTYTNDTSKYMMFLDNIVVRVVCIVVICMLCLVDPVKAPFGWRIVSIQKLNNHNRKANNNANVR